MGRGRHSAPALFGLLAILFAGPADRVSAHENHQHEQVERIDTAGAAPAIREQAAEARDKPWPARLANWMGRVHPFAVHFPIALVPVSLFALVLARRHGEAAEIIRALIIVAGLSAAIAAGLGWLDGGFALVDRDPVKLWHRWIGTGLGAAGAVMALWAWRRQVSASGRTMIAALGLMTLALLVQAWLGGAMVHGIRHMNW